jgi:membrane peptidoglycan carboxypeptidase
MLNGVVQDGTGTPVRFDDGRPSAGKTGTTNGSAQVWFVGYTPQLAGAALISDTASTTEHLDDGQTIHGRVPGIVTGGGLAGPVWHDAVGGALKGVDFAQFHLVDLPADARKAAPPDKSGEPKKADGTDGTDGADPLGGR